MNEKVKIRALKKTQTPGKSEIRGEKKDPVAKPSAVDTEKSISGFIEKAKQFFREVKIEFKKVVWPSRKELISTTIVAVVLVILVAAFLGLVDLILSKLVGFLLGRV